MRAEVFAQTRSMYIIRDYGILLERDSRLAQTFFSTQTLGGFIFRF